MIPVFPAVKPSRKPTTLTSHWLRRLFELNGIEACRAGRRVYVDYYVQFRTRWPRTFDFFAVYLDDPIKPTCGAWIEETWELDREVHTEDLAPPPVRWLCGADAVKLLAWVRRCPPIQVVDTPSPWDEWLSCSFTLRHSYTHSVRFRPMRASIPGLADWLDEGTELCLNADEQPEAEALRFDYRNSLYELSPSPFEEVELKVERPTVVPFERHPRAVLYEKVKGRVARHTSTGLLVELEGGEIAVLDQSMLSDEAKITMPPVGSPITTVIIKRVGGQRYLSHCPEHLSLGIRIVR